MVKIKEIKGIPSQEEAITLYDNWKKEIDDWNEKAKRHNTALIYSVIAACVIATVIIFWTSGWTTDVKEFGVIRILLVSVIPAIGILTVLFGWTCKRNYNDFFWPLKYKYYAITNGKNILDSWLKDGVLYFILENEKHEVSRDLLVGFTKKYRTDVDEVIVDMDNAEILIPYKRDIVESS